MRFYRIIKSANESEPVLSKRIATCSFNMRAFAGEFPADFYESVFLAYKTHR